MELDRRDLIKKGAIAGGAVWIAPTLLSATTAAAASVPAVPCDGQPHSVLITSGLPTTNPGAVTILTTTVTVCRGPGQSVTFSGASGSNTQFYLDEILTITGAVTSPVYYFWPSGTGCSGSLNSSPGNNGLSSAGGLDVTSLFPANTPMAVTISLKNCANPAGTQDRPLWLNIL